MYSKPFKGHHVLKQSTRDLNKMYWKMNKIIENEYQSKIIAKRLYLDRHRLPKLNITMMNFLDPREAIVYLIAITYIANVIIVGARIQIIIIGFWSRSL